MEKLVTYLSGEGRIILQAPASLFVVVFLVSGLVWAVLSWYYSGQISNMQSRITLRDDQIADYKEKLNGATPDEARKRLDALELQVKALSPRRLTDEQKRKITAALNRTSGVIEIAQDMAAPDAKAYTGDFAQAFQAAGWQVMLPSVLGPGIVPPTGAALQVVDLASLSPSETAVKRALEVAGVEFDVALGRRPPRPKAPNIPNLQSYPEPDVNMLFTTRLK